MCDFYRILIASKDIAAGELILSEFPIVKYPQWKTSPACLGCYELINADSYVLCANCNWPVCSEACSKAEDHLLECHLFQKCHVKIEPNEISFDGPMRIYDVITPLRMLALRDQGNGQKWAQLRNLESHKDKWEQQTGWREQLDHAIKFMLETMKLPGVDEVLILELFGIAYVNDFSSLMKNVRVRLSFPNAAMFSHDCIPNVVRHIEGLSNGHQIKCYAARDIKRGERLTTTYVDLFLPRQIRRDILRKVSRSKACSTYKTARAIFFTADTQRLCKKK